MNEDPGVDYLNPWMPGELIHGSSGVGVVLESNHTDYKAGDLVMAVMKWPWVKYFSTFMAAGGGHVLDQSFQKVSHSGTFNLYI